MTKWNKHILSKNDFNIKNVGGVYCFLLNKSCVYIGQSKNVLMRIKAHGYYKDTLNKKQLFGDKNDVTLKIKYVESFVDRLKLEASLINKIRPSHNKKILYGSFHTKKFITIKKYIQMEKKRDRLVEKRKRIDFQIESMNEKLSIRNVVVKK